MRTRPTGIQHVGPDGQPLAWYEWIYANPGEVVRMNEPEFVVSVPQHAVPCEVTWLPSVLVWLPVWLLASGFWLSRSRLVFKSFLFFIVFADVFVPFLHHVKATNPTTINLKHET